MKLVQDLAPATNPPKTDGDLSHLLEETRILLPGAELLAAFLVALPFTDRFESLTTVQRVLYVAAFIAAIISLACFQTPSAYHRIARPIQDKAAFKLFANRFIVAGIIPFALALIGVTHLVTSMAANDVVATVLASLVGVMLMVLWWIIPWRRAHEKQ